MRVEVVLRVDVAELPEGMTPEDLRELVRVPFEAACSATFDNMKRGPARTALVVASLPVILHEALVHVGVDTSKVHRYRSALELPTQQFVRLSARWNNLPGRPYENVQFEVALP